MKAILLLTLMFVIMFAAPPVSAQQALPAQDVQSLAGKWVGWLTPTSGGNIPVTVQVAPDGSYTSTIGSTIGKGMIQMDAGKLMAEGQLITGSRTAEAGVGRSQLNLVNKDGKQMMTGRGRDNQGPFEFQLTKQ